MSYSKPLLIPWLRDKINSGKYPGVHWTNTKLTEFCIPWKHALRQDSSDTDILIFKAWAEVSGNGRAQGDASVWKRNFRSALRAKKFRLIFDNKNDAANPHKVFRWPVESASGGNSSAGSQELDEADLFDNCSHPVQESQSQVDFLSQTDDTDSAVHCDILQQCLEGLSIGPEPEGIAGFEPPPEQQQPEIQAVIGAEAFPGQQQYPVRFEGAVVEAGLPEQPAYPMEAAVGGSSDWAENFLQTMYQTRDEYNFRTHFRVLVYYRGVKVSEQLVSNEAGFRLVYRPELIGIGFDPESGLSIVSLPSPGAMLDQTQTRLTQRILDNLGDGLEIGVSGPLVYGQRQGDIKAFWSRTKHDTSRQIQEIPKIFPEPLFEFRDFVQGLMDFIDNRDSPPCSLFFCLGEKWPDPDNRPWDKKLITVEVVMTSMELLKNMAVDGGSSSLRSVELQISLEEMMEH